MPDSQSIPKTARFGKFAWRSGGHHHVAVRRNDRDRESPDMSRNCKDSPPILRAPLRNASVEHAIILNKHILSTRRPKSIARTPP